MAQLKRKKHELSERSVLMPLKKPIVDSSDQYAQICI